MLHGTSLNRFQLALTDEFLDVFLYGFLPSGQISDVDPLDVFLYGFLYGSIPSRQISDARRFFSKRFTDMVHCRSIETREIRNGSVGKQVLVQLILGNEFLTRDFVVDNTLGNGLRPFLIVRVLLPHFVDTGVQVLHARCVTRG